MKLRPATDADKEYFRTLRNDPDAVKFSYTKREVTEDEHDYWWDVTGDVRLVAEGAGGDSVGVVRLTPLDAHTCEVHLTVAADKRGLGHAGEMLRLARKEAAWRGYERLIARVDAPNTASLRAFLRAGYDVVTPGTFMLERGV